MIQALAPMDGITDIVYRSIVSMIFKEQKAKNNTLRTRTEFMNADGYMIQPHKLAKHLIHHDQEEHLIAQIYGGNEETLIQTAIDIEKKYPNFFGIELNIGCPSPKVMACGWGSGMMQNKAYTLQVIKNISKKITKPFSIKVRTWLNEGDKEERYKTLIKASSHVHCISVHGRTFKQGHSGLVDRDYIYKLKNDLPNTTIIGNGWVQSYDETQSRLKNLDGIMTAQAAIANPRLFTQTQPTIIDYYNICKKHLSLAVWYEVRYNRMVKENKQLEIVTKKIENNRQYLHALKHYNENQDQRTEKLKITPHNYKFPIPKRDELEDIAQNISGKTSSEERKGLHSPIQFRKFLFNYVKWLPGSKDLKQKISEIYDREQLQTSIDNFFHAIL